MSNINILERNIIHSIRGAAQLCYGDDFNSEAAIALADDAEYIFFRWKARDALLAEQCALQWIKIKDFISTFDLCSLYPESAVSEVMDFMKERHCRNIFPQKNKEKSS